MAHKEHLSILLEDILLQDFISIKEYQDKYFFVKRVEQLFPAINEAILYRALESTNNFFGKPIKKKLFIDKFTSEIYKMNV